MGFKSEEIFSLTREALENYETNKANNLGKLTYLSLTGKPEGPIRDRVAWLFQKKFSEEGSNLLSSREYKRYDLAILKPNEKTNKKEPKVKHIYEFKVGFAANFRDGLKQGNKYVDRVIGDFQKSFDNDDLNKTTCIFIGVEPLQEVEKNEYVFIKYAGRINSLRKKINKETLNKNYIHQKVVNKFKSRPELELKKNVSIELKPFNGKNVRLHLLILRPNLSEFVQN